MRRCSECNDPLTPREMARGFCNFFGGDFTPQPDAECESPEPDPFVGFQFSAVIPFVGDSFVAIVERS